MHGATFLADLAVVLGVGAVTSVLARLLRQPTILGYLLAGLIVGPYLPIPIFADPERVQALAEFGVALVMFGVGLDFRIARLLRVLPVSGLTGLVQVSFLLWCGFSAGKLLGWTTLEATFLGTSLAISSTMVVTRVFEETSVRVDVREHVLGVLIFQDVVAIFLIAAMTAVAAGEGLAPAELGWTLARLSAVLAALFVGGLLVLPRVMRAVVRLKSNEILAVVSIGVCFGIARLADELGYSVALGAFVAGILVAESGRASRVEHVVAPLRDVFAAIFFVSVGMAADPRLAIAHLPAAALVFGIVVLGQLVSVAVGGVLSGLGLRRSLIGGLALGQIGEFSFILASIGIGAGVVRPELMPILVTVAVLTAFTTPMLLRRAEPIVRFCDRRLPERAHRVLGLHEAWLERYRKERAGSAPRRAIRALVTDAIALLVLLSLTASGLPQASTYLAERFHLSLVLVELVLGVCVLVAAMPLLARLVRNTLAFSRRVSGVVAPGEVGATSADRLAEHTARVMIVLAVVLAVGVPAATILRPFTGGAFGLPVLALILAGIGLHLWRSAGAMEEGVRSGVEEIAALLARQSGFEEEEEEEAARPSLPGLDAAFHLQLEPAATAVGRTLAELDVRARSGATVVAIQRGSEILMPTGREALAAGDVLAISGTSEAVERASRLLREGERQRSPVSAAPSA